MSIAPPLISEVMIPGPDSPVVDIIRQKQQMIAKLRENLAQAQSRIKNIHIRKD
jgi:hypothetical protein